VVVDRRVRLLLRAGGVSVELLPRSSVVLTCDCGPAPAAPGGDSSYAVTRDIWGDPAGRWVQYTAGTDSLIYADGPGGGGGWPTVMTVWVMLIRLAAFGDTTTRVRYLILRFFPSGDDPEGWFFWDLGEGYTLEPGETADVVLGAPTDFHGFTTMPVRQYGVWGIEACAEQPLPGATGNTWHGYPVDDDWQTVGEGHDALGRDEGGNYVIHLQWYLRALVPPTPHSSSYVGADCGPAPRPASIPVSLVVDTALSPPAEGGGGRYARSPLYALAADQLVGPNGTLCGWLENGSMHVAWVGPEDADDEGGTLGLFGGANVTLYGVNPGHDPVPILGPGPRIGTTGAAAGDLFATTLGLLNPHQTSLSYEPEDPFPIRRVLMGMSFPLQPDSQFYVEAVASQGGSFPGKLVWTVAFDLLLGVSHSSMFMQCA
jgi:hypothetical protein